jgi:hypothetical protein
VSRKSNSSSNSGPLVCPSCARRYDLDERFCASCRMPLVYAPEAATLPAHDELRERARKVRPEYSRGNLRRVATASNQAEGEMIQGLLLEEGIPSVLRRSAGFDVPDFLAAGPRDVMVPESGEEAGRELLRAADLEPATARSPVRERGSGGTRREALVLLAVMLTVGAVGALVLWLLLRAA